MKHSQNPIIAVILLLCALPVQMVLAQPLLQALPATEVEDTFSNSDYLSRGELVKRTIERFELKSRNEQFLGKCWQNLDECFFVFAAQSDFDDIAFEPLTLYPDVPTESIYYDAINTASMLGLVHGYINEERTPFKPYEAATRIQALKVALGAMRLVDWKERFELKEDFSEEELESYDWWYGRYVEFALENRIISESFGLEPDVTITVVEMEELLNNILHYNAGALSDHSQDIHEATVSTQPE